MAAKDDAGAEIFCVNVAFSLGGKSALLGDEDTLAAEALLTASEHIYLRGEAVEA